MLWQQDTGGTVPCTGTCVQPSCAPVQTSMGESSRPGVTPLSLFLDTDSGARLHPPWGGQQKGTGPHDGTGTVCLPPSWIFGTALTTDPAGDA